MLSLTKAPASGTAKKRQHHSRHDAGVDSKRRRYEAREGFRKPNIKPKTCQAKTRKSSPKNAARTVTSSSLKVSETPSAGEQPSNEESCRGRRRWRAGSEPHDWDEREWYLGDSMVASVEDKPEKHGSRFTTNASASTHDSDEEHEPFPFEFLDESSCESERIQPSSTKLAASVQKLKEIQHNSK